MNRAEKKTPEQEAIVFLHSMLKLVERRGLRYVDEQFGFSMTAMSTSILGPTHAPCDFTGNQRHREALSAAAGLIDEFPGSRVPIAALKAAVLVIEAALREETGESDHEPTSAPQEARS